MRLFVRKLTAAQQYLALQSSHAWIGKGSVRKGFLIWNYETRPTPISRNYKLRLTFQQGKPPKILVVEPNLAMLANGRSLPHVYKQEPAQLCLYLPGTGEWRRDLVIEKTILPWSTLWLYYFEIWLATGKWEGGGVHPKVKHDE